MTNTQEATIETVPLTVAVNLAATLRLIEMLGDDLDTILAFREGLTPEAEAFIDSDVVSGTVDAVAGLTLESVLDSLFGGSFGPDFIDIFFSADV